MRQIRQSGIRFLRLVLEGAPVYLRVTAGFNGPRLAAVALDMGKT
jgi:hypothetical protein